jgi:hypothetical protein
MDLVPQRATDPTVPMALEPGMLDRPRSRSRLTSNSRVGGWGGGVARPAPSNLALARALGRGRVGCQAGPDGGEALRWSDREAEQGCAPRVGRCCMSWTFGPWG